MNRRIVAALGLLLIDLGVFIATCSFLPQRGSFGHSGPWSYFINSRGRWDVAWGVFVAATVLSMGAFLLMESLGAFERKTNTIEPISGDDS